MRRIPVAEIEGRKNWWSAAAYTPAKFWAKVRRFVGPNACWLWTGGIAKKTGYGKLKYRGKFKHAHQVAFTLSKGPISAGKIVCHTCDVPLCCRPKHLYAGTHKNNTADMLSRGRAGFQQGPVDYGDRKGTANPNTVLTEKRVRRIRRLNKRDNKHYSFAALARKFGVGESTISAVVHRRSWRHI